MEDKRIVITLIEHLGDIIACEPVSRYARKQYPNSQITWVSKSRYAEVLACNPNIDELIFVENLTEWDELRKQLPETVEVIDLHFYGRICMTTYNYIYNKNDPSIVSENYYKHGSLLEAFSQSARLPKLSDAPVFHLAENIKKHDLPDNYVVFHCQSNEESRDWTAENWNKLAEELFKLGIPVVELGLQNVIHTNNPLYLNFTHLRTIQEIAVIIKDAKTFVGIDSAFAHIANAFEVYGVVLLGSYRAFDKYMPYTGNYQKGINCSIIQNDGPASLIPIEPVLGIAIKAIKPLFINQTGE